MLGNDGKFNKVYRGIVYFDIDGTLTSVNDIKETELIIDECLKRNYMVGIITASTRTISDLKPNDWMSENFYSHLKDHSFITFNSFYTIAGNSNENITYFLDQLAKDFNVFSAENIGKRKGVQMYYGWRYLTGENVNPNRIILFDDLFWVLKYAQTEFPNGTFVHVSRENPLNHNLVKNVLDELDNNELKNMIDTNINTITNNININTNTEYIGVGVGIL